MKVVWLCHYNLFNLKDKITISDTYSSHPATWIYYLSEAFKNIPDVDLHIITMTDGIAKSYSVSEKNITYHLVNARVPRSRNSIAELFNKILRLQIRRKVRSEIVQTIREITPDIINVHGTEFQYGTWIKKKNRKKTVIWMQGVMNFALKDQHNKSALNSKRSEIKIFESYTYFISKRGNMEEEIFRHNSNVKFFNIFYPVSPYAFQLYKENTQKTNDIIFVGSIIKRKGIEDFIAAVKIIKRSLPGIRARFIGQAPDSVYVQHVLSFITESGLQENVIYDGALPEHEAVLLAVRNSKILVLPTYADTAPVVVAESMAMGTAVIAYNVDGLPGMITHNETGILVELGNVTQLAAEITDCLHKGTYKDYIVRAHAFAEREYLPEVTAQKAYDVYKYICKANQNIA